MKRVTFIGILTFLGLFVYFYKTSRKFRKSILTSFLVVSSRPLEAEAKGAEASTPQQQITRPIGRVVFLVVQ